MTSPSDSSASEDRVEVLVAECLERDPDEPTRVVEDVCSDDPELADEVRQSLDALNALGLGFDARAEGDMPLRLGGYRLVRPLGAGAMGVVYLAEKEPEGLDVALKILRPELLYFPRAQERFRREMRIIANLQHPGIVRLHAHGETDGLPWIALERAPGDTIERVLAELTPTPVDRRTGDALLRAVRGLSEDPGASGRPPHPYLLTSWTNAALHLVREVALALAHAHARGVVHRDVKPSNIMLTPDGRPLLFDFGLATEDRGSQSLTRSGLALGSEAYMAPEVLGGESRADERSDVYSLGVVLFELLSGERPFLGDGRAGFRVRVLAGETPSVRSAHAGVSEDADRVCRKAMARDPASRYPSAQAFADDLGRVLEHRPVRARPPSRARRLVKWMRRRPELAAVGAVLLGTFTAMGILWQDNQRMEDEIAARDRRHVDQVQGLTELLTTLEPSPDMPAHEIYAKAFELASDGDLPPLELADLALAAARDLRALGATERSASISRSALGLFELHAPDDIERQAQAVIEHVRALVLLGEVASAREFVRAWTAEDLGLSDAQRAELLMLQSAAQPNMTSTRAMDGLLEAERLNAGRGNASLHVEILLEQARHHQGRGRRAQAREVQSRARLLADADGVSQLLRRSVELRVAECEYEFGDWTRSLEQFEGILVSMEAELPPGHLDLVEPLAACARALMRLGRYEESLESARRALQLVELHAEGHHATDGLHNLAASAAAAVGDRASAEHHAARALALAEATGIVDRRFVAMASRARVAHSLGDLLLARDLYEDAVDVQADSVVRHGRLAHQAWARANLAVVLGQLGLTAESEAQLRTARDLLESGLTMIAEQDERRISRGREPLSETLPTTIGTHRMLGHVLLELGEADAAEVQLARVAELVGRLQGADHWTVHFARAHRARALVARGELDAAAEVLEAAWPVVAREVGERAYTFRLVADAMVELHEARGDAEQRDGWLERRGVDPLQVPALGF